MSMNGTREEFLEWDQLMQEIGLPRERYANMVADRLARLIVNSTPQHLSLNEWQEEIDKAINRLLT